MTGNAHQRRIKRRLQERLSKRAIELGSGVWATPKFKETLDSISQPEKPAEVEKAISAAPALRSGGKPPKEVIPDTTKPIAPPEPRGEAEGVLEALKQMNEYANEELKAGRLRSMIEGGYIPTADKRGKEFDVGWPKKRRTLWNWLRKLVRWN